MAKTKGKSDRVDKVDHNKQIKKMKKELDSLKKKYLKNRKKRTVDKSKYKKARKNINKAVGDASTLDQITRLLTLFRSGLPAATPAMSYSERIKSEDSTR